VLPALLVIAATALTVVVPELSRRSTRRSGGGADAGGRPLRRRRLSRCYRPRRCGRGRHAPPAEPARELRLAGVPPAKSSPRPGAIRRAPRSSRAPPAALLAVGLAFAGYTLVNVALLSYAAFAVPVGAVAGRRTRIDDAKDRELADFVHAVSGTRRAGAAVPRGGRGGRARRGPRRARRRRGRPRVRAPVGRRPRRGGGGSTGARETRGVRVRRHSRPASARPRSIGLSSASERRWPRGHSGSSPTP